MKEINVDKLVDEFTAWCLAMEKYEEIEKELQVELLAKDYLDDNEHRIDYDFYIPEVIENTANNEAEVFLISKTFKGIELVLDFPEIKANFVKEVVKQYGKRHTKGLFDWLKSSEAKEFFEKELKR